MRIVFDQQIYNIVKIISDLSSKKYLRLIAEEAQEWGDGPREEVSADVAI